MLEKVAAAGDEIYKPRRCLIPRHNLEHPPKMPPQEQDALTTRQDNPHPNDYSPHPAKRKEAGTSNISSANIETHLALLVMSYTITATEESLM